MFFKNLFVPVVLLGVLKQNLGFDACKKKKNKQNKNKIIRLLVLSCIVL